MSGFMHHFVIVSRRFFRVHQCVCALGDLMSLFFWGAIDHIVCVLSVCMSCVRFCGEMVEVLLLMRVPCVCGCRSANVSTR